MPEKKRKNKPAKNPPPLKPRKAKRTPVQKKAKRTPVQRKQTTGRKPKTIIEFDESSPAYPYLRHSAGIAYATDLKLGSLQELSRRPVFSVVSLKSLGRWSVEDGWVERRRAFIEELRKQQEKAVGTALVQSQLAQLKRIESIEEDAFKTLMTKSKKNMLDANSKEGMMNAYVRVVQMLNDQREKLADAILPEPIAIQQQENQLPSVRPRLSMEESRAAALTIVRMRREEIRAALRVEEDEKDGLKTPPMRVIEGEK